MIKLISLLFIFIVVNSCGSDPGNKIITAKDVSLNFILNDNIKYRKSDLQVIATLHCIDQAVYIPAMKEQWKKFNDDEFLIFGNCKGSDSVLIKGYRYRHYISNWKMTIYRK